FPTAGCTLEQASDIRGGAASSGGCVIRVDARGNAIANQNLQGRTLPHAPDYSGALFLDYNADIGDDMSWFFGVEVNFTDGYITTGDLDPIDSEDAWEKINVRAGIRTDHWEFMVFGKNITDEETASGGFDVPLASGTHAIYTDPGEIYGVRVAYSF
ncbi:MAG: TonB-dependent receptor, partial [Arenicella sp.]|nr:TonB-dependent receptor [Arenicella sp.]